MKKSTIVLIVAAVACLGLAVLSAKLSVTRTEKAISNIGEVTYSEECKDKIDLAVSYYNALDTNLKLDKKITNTEDFDTAKIEYVRLAIKAAVVADERKEAEDYSTADVQEFITAARETLEAYLLDVQYEQVENYSDLTALESAYSSGGGSDDSDSTEEAETVPMC